MRSSHLAGFTTVLLCSVALLCAPVFAETGPMFSGLVLVEEINCATTSPGASSGTNAVQTILGQQCRVIPNSGSSDKYFAYRIGQNKGLQAGKAYILTVDYPEDQPRAMFVVNRGCETTEGFHTGKTVGIAMDAPYTGPGTVESLNYPMSGEYETWQQLFHLHDKFYSALDKSDGRTWTPASGFWVIIAQFAAGAAPMSQGAAVSRIALYEAPDLATYTMPLNMPGLGLPRRHISWREEMADGVAGTGVLDKIDWYEYKARLSKFLGINGYTKDLLEFGANQDWDSSKYGGHGWYFMGPTPGLWEDIVELMGQYGLDVLPYYEYCGSKGYTGLGPEKHARPLTDTNEDLDYTHVYWTEVANADLTYWETIVDIEKLLDCTVLEFLDLANYRGVWFRNRPSQIPISFSDDALGQFAEEANGGVAVTRADLIASWTLRSSYYTWWFERRHEFFIRIRDFMRTRGVGDDAVFLYSYDSGEPGTGINYAVVTDNVSAWTALGKTAVNIDTAIADDLHYDEELSWRSTWSPWEWHHSCPPPDPSRYYDDDGILFNSTFNHLYTTSSPTKYDQWRNAWGGMAITRHYHLNEAAMDNLGYWVSDINMAGPYTMMAEARAMAYGNPYYITYLASAAYNRGFPQYVRNFNAAFLALPALPSVELVGVASNYQVVVREIDAGDYGKYYYAVNTGMQSVPSYTINLGTTVTPGTVKNLVTGEDLMVAGNIILAPAMYPGEMLSFRIFSGNEPPGVDAGASNTVQLPETSYDLHGQIDDDGPIGNVTTTWSVVQGSGVIIDDVEELDTTVTFPGYGTYVLRLTADDGMATNYDDITLYVKLPPGPNLLWSDEDLGGGLYGFTFYISNDDELSDTYTVELGFQGVDGAEIRQIKYNGTTSIHSETFATMVDGTGGYVKAEDTWAFSPFGDNTYPGTNPLTGLPLTGFYEAANAFAMSCWSGSGATLGDGVNVVYVVADGNVAWTGNVYRMGETYATSGTTTVVLNPPDPPTGLGDFNGDRAVTGADYVMWADNFGGSDEVFAYGSHNGDGSVTGSDYVTWADNFGNTYPIE